MQDPPYHLLPHECSPFLPESFPNLSSWPCSDWQQHQIPLVTKITEGRFEQAVTVCFRANANSDLMPVCYNVRSGTRSSVVHTSSLHGCLIRSVWATRSHGNQSVTTVCVRAREEEQEVLSDWDGWWLMQGGLSGCCSVKAGADGWTSFNEFDNIFFVYCFKFFLYIIWVGTEKEDKMTG